HVRESFDGLSRVERWPLTLINDTIQEQAPLLVLVRDAERRVIDRAAAHVNKAVVSDAGLWPSHRHAPLDGGHNLSRIVAAALGAPGQVQMQSAVFVTRQSSLLLDQIPRIFPTRSRRIRLAFGR